MITLRDFREDDIKDIDRIYKSQTFGVPGLDNVIISKVIECDGVVVGYGVVKQFAEGVLILDGNLEEIKKAKAIRESMKVAIAACDMLGVEQFYITTPFQNFRDILQKHYGFVECQDKFLLLNL